MNCEDHGSMTCREFSEFVLAYLDGDLAASQHAVFERHLSLCPDCDNYMRTYKTSIDVTKSACDGPPADAPEQLIQAILRARDT